MNIIESIFNDEKINKILESIYSRINDIAQNKLDDLKVKMAEVRCEEITEAIRHNPNIMRMGKIQKIRRRVRRNAKGGMYVQKNARRSTIKGYRISGNTLKRISATARIRKSRLLKQSWRTTRKSKFRRTLMKKNISMRRRASLGLR